MATERMWSTGTEPNAFAALPAGAVGRFGGWLMARTNRRQQEQVLGRAAVAEGERVLEVGHGPGVLLQLLAARTPAGEIVGVDPSAEMRAAAIARNAPAVASGRIGVAVGTASATGQPDAAFDLVVAVNNVAIWPDLAAGAAELARVLRPGGRLLVSWHGGTAPTRMVRALMLPEEKLTRIADALAGRFRPVSRLRTERCELFLAERPR